MQQQTIAANSSCSAKATKTLDQSRPPMPGMMRRKGLTAQLVSATTKLPSCPVKGNAHCLHDETQQEKGAEETDDGIKQENEGLHQLAPSNLPSS
jgi:hypothetical protein